MKKTIIISSLFISLFTNNAHSQLVTMDMTNLPQNIMTAVNTMNQISEMVKQYQTLIQQYELMVKDFEKPLMWVWKQVNHFDKNNALYKEQFKIYDDKAAWENYLKDYLDLSSFDKNNCFNSNGCSDREKRKIQQDRQFFIEYAAKVSKDVVNNLSNFTTEYENAKKQLKLIQKEAERAEGNVQSQAVLAQYLQAANENLINLRKDISTIQQQIASVNNIKLNEAALKEAQSKTTYNVNFKDPELLFGK